MQVLVALSGGVDSAVAAALLKESGFTVTGVYFRSWQNERENFGQCPWKEDMDSARAVADVLQIEFRVLNLIEKYREHVVRYLIDGYQKGFTPNPDIMCNRHIKFGFLLDYALTEGFSYLATGHYCINEKNITTGNHTLYEADDKNKDQSYFLCLVKKTALPKLLFPLGRKRKPEVRQLAKKLNLPNALRKDSQGICFLGNSQVPINEFLSQYLPESPGEIITPEGKVIGEHKGLYRYTIGQRKGINIPSNSDFNHYVVIRKNLETNQLIVAFESQAAQEGLWHSKTIVERLNFFANSPHDGEQLLGKPRYRDLSQAITYHTLENERAEVIFHKPQRALAPGQIIAFYRGNELLGGGVYTQTILAS